MKVLLIFLMLGISVPAFGQTIPYQIQLVEQTGLRDINVRGDLIADVPTTGGLLIPNKGRNGPVAIDCLGAFAGSTQVRKLTNARTVAGSCDLTADADLSVGFVRFQNGQYAFLDVPGADITDVYAVADGIACGQYYGPFDFNQSGFARIHGFCWNQITNHYETIDFPAPFAVTAVLGVNERGLRVGAYFTYNPATNLASEWTWFTYQNGQFSPLIHPSGWTYALDLNKWGDVLIVHDDRPGGFLGGPSEPWSMAYSIWSNGRFSPVGLPTETEQGKRITSWDINGINDDGDIVGDVTWFERCAVLLGGQCLQPVLGRSGFIGTAVQERRAQR